MNRILLAALAATSFAGSAYAIPSTEPMVQTASWCRGWLQRAEYGKRCVACEQKTKVLFLGDSITDFFKPGWGSAGGNVWTNHFGAKGNCPAMDLGVSGDRTEHLLWRLRDGQIDKTSAKVIVLMIGINNILQRKEEDEPVVDTILGVKAVLDEVRKRAPQAKVILHPIFPCKDLTHLAERRRQELVSHELKKFADGKDIVWLDFNSRLLDAGGRYPAAMSKDGIHPTEPGYVIWAEELMPRIRMLLGEKDIVMPPECPPTKKYPTLEYLDNAERSPLVPELAFNWLNRIGQRRDQIFAARRDNGAYIDAVLLGDSITHHWETTGKGVFGTRLKDYRILNAGYSGAGTQHILWNLRYGGMLDGFICRAVTLMIGTNNYGGKNDTPEQVANATFEIMKEIRARQPGATLIYHPILPRDGKDDAHRAFNDQVNALVKARLESDDKSMKNLSRGVIRLDLAKAFLAAAGNLAEGAFGDKLHPTERGYAAWADALLPELKKACGK